MIHVLPKIYRSESKVPAVSKRLVILLKSPTVLLGGMYTVVSIIDQMAPLPPTYDAGGPSLGAETLRGLAQGQSICSVRPSPPTSPRVLSSCLMIRALLV